LLGDACFKLGRRAEAAAAYRAAIALAPRDSSLRERLDRVAPAGE
jgi:Flp pilus assembly protein TadD